MIAECYSPLELVQNYINPLVQRPECQMLLGDMAQPTYMRWPRYFLLFGLTCLLEAPVYCLAARGFSFQKRLAMVVLLNLATHPAVTWIFPQLFASWQLSTRDLVLSSELFAPLVEGVLLRSAFGFSWKGGLGTAIAANFVSWWGGIYVAYMLGLTA